MPMACARTAQVLFLSFDDLAIVGKNGNISAARGFNFTCPGKARLDGHIRTSTKARSYKEHSGVIINLT